MLPIAFLTLFSSPQQRLALLLELLLNGSFIMLYANLAQLLLLMKTPRRAFWATGIITAIIVLPASLTLFFGYFPGYSTLLLFSPFSFIGLKITMYPLIFFSLLIPILISILLNIKIIIQLKSLKQSSFLG